MGGLKMVVVDVVVIVVHSTGKEIYRGPHPTPG